MMKTYKLLVVCEQDPSDVPLERTGIPASALDAVRSKLPILDGFIDSEKRKASGAPRGFAALFGRRG